MAECKRAIALGFFDGVHVGHAALLNKTKERAAQIGAMPSVLSFDVHPDNLVLGREVPLINSAIGREDIIRRCFGIDNVVFIHFNRHVMCMPWQEFVDSIIAELNVAWVVVGHDFTFGYKGQGNPQRLTEYCAQRGIGCDVIPAVTMDGRVVSSTYIRELIRAGNVKEANHYLGHPHMLADTVHSGYHLGTKMGTPTINMYFPEGVLVPRYGVYATKVILENGDTHMAVTNVGTRPTVDDGDQLTIEGFILDFSGDLYGQKIQMEFYQYLREEKKFPSFQALQEEIARNVEQTRAYFAENP